MQKNRVVQFILSLSLLVIHPQLAHTVEKSSERLCIAQLLRLEKHHQIPKGLLSAIAQTESGRKLSKNKSSVPWPWAVNVQGKAIYFSTKEQAITEVRRLLNQGVRNIDIGCMQINYHHHGHHFPSLMHMFEPKHNVAYGAKFLKDLRKVNGSWTKAVGLYHSATPELQVPYKRRVYIKWQQEQKRLYQEEFMSAQASLQTKRLYQVIPTPNANFKSSPPVIVMTKAPAGPRNQVYYSTSQQELARIRNHRETSPTPASASPQFFQRVEP